MNWFPLRLVRTATTRPYVAALAAVTILALGATPAAAFNETGGSGLIRTEEAFSLPIGRPLFSVYAGAFSNDFTPGTSRMFSFTPSLTLGLGGGFEGAAAMSFEGLTSSIDDGSFDRRFDFRRRALQTKLRWTTDIGSPRLRAGVMGHLTLPLWIDERPGGLVDPKDNYDVGAMGLVSANLGWFDVPVRLHLNAGYWRSRNDGAFIYRSLPTSIPVTGMAADRNDVLEYGLALEAGLRRAAVFVELRTEQFVDAREAVASRENLWTVTPGFRTQLTSSVGLTGGVSFDLSSNDEGTAFDPAVAYPDYELKLGLTLGSVLSRQRHEEARRNERRPEIPASAQATASPVAPAAPMTVPSEPAARPEAAAAAPVTPAVTAPAPLPVESDAARIRELEDRLARLETAQRIAFLEARLAALEGRSVIPASPAVPAPAPVQAPTPVAVEKTAAPAGPDATTEPAAKAEPMATAEPVTKAESATTAEPVTKAEPTAAAEPVTEAEPTVTPGPAAEAEPAVTPEATTGTEPAFENLPAAKVPPVSETLPAATIEPTTAVGPTAANEPAVKSEPAPVVAEVPVAAATSPAAVSPEVQTQLDRLMQEIQALRDENAAQKAAASVPVAVTPTPTVAATPPAAAVADQPDRATVITTGGGSTTPSVVAIPVPSRSTADPAAQPSAGSQPEAVRESGTPALEGLLPELREPFSPATPAASAAPDTLAPKAAVVATEAPAPAAAAPVPTFGLEVGASRSLAAVDAAATAPLASPAAQAELNAVAAELAAFPTAAVALLVHGGAADRAAALTETDALAALIRDYLVAAGAPVGSVLPIGMGRSEQATPLVEIERIR